MKNKGLNISSSQLEDFIWMSYRYCIGRHTIAASMHANTISRVLNENPGVLGKEKIDFMVKDIRTSILDIIRWYPNVKVVGSFDCSWDMYSKLLAVMSICPNPNNVIYTINLSEQTITWKESEKTFDSIDKFYHDIIPWVRLANLLDSNNYAEVTAKFNDKEHKIICYQYAIRNSENKYELVWNSIEDWVLNNTYPHINPEYITNINYPL